MVRHQTSFVPMWSQDMAGSMHAPITPTSAAAATWAKSTTSNNSNNTDSSTSPWSQPWDRHEIAHEKKEKTNMSIFPLIFPFDEHIHIRIAFFFSFLLGESVMRKRPFFFFFFLFFYTRGMSLSFFRFFPHPPSVRFVIVDLANVLITPLHILPNEQPTYPTLSQSRPMKK
jgi:hypothetical protein